MPFVFNSLRGLASAGWSVDVYLWEQQGHRYAELFPTGIVFHYQRGSLQDSRTAEAFRSGPGYRCVFGVGQMGAHIAGVVARRNGCPLILLNNEFPSQWGTTPLAPAEVAAATQSTLIVVPDACRAVPLLNELGLPQDKPCAVIPNGPADLLPKSNDDWHRRLELDAGQAICLHAGSISDFAQVPELMSTVPYWPEGAVLVLNGRNLDCGTGSRQSLAHLELPGRIVWSAGALSEEELHSLVAAAALGFALYRNTGPNIEYAGASSGKLLRSIAAGVPVIASRLASFQFIEEHGLGVLVHHPQEIPAAIRQVLTHRDEYARNCRRYFEENFRFAPHWESLCSRLRELTGLDLSLGPASE